MKKIIFITTLLLPIISLAQSTNLEQTIDLENYLQFLIQSLGGLKGASSLASIAIITQIIMQTLRLPFVQSKLPPLMGKHKFTIIYLLSTITGILTLKIQGLGWLTSLIHSNTLAAYQILIHQAFKQFKEKNN